MDQLTGDLLNDSDSEDQDYVPSGGESEHESEVEEVEKDVLKDADQNEKQKADALWADFMSDVGEPLAKKKKVEEDGKKKDEENGKNNEVDKEDTKASDVDKEKVTNTENTQSSQLDHDKPGTSKITIKQVFDFAGEKIEVEKEVDKDSKEAKKLLAEQEKMSNQKTALLVRPKVGGGLSQVVGGILNKKSKMSILEKSKMDWTTFKKQEGIEEELKTHNIGKGGYLEKLAFLDRSDLRQFEIEKAIREKQRASRGSN